MHKQEPQPYHIDYVFVPEESLTSKAAVAVGTYADWIDASDHMPVLAEIKE